MNFFTNSSAALNNPRQQAFYKSLGAEIRALRGSRTQEDLAKAVGLTRTSIVNIEAGNQKLLLHNLFGIAAFLGCRPSELISKLEPISSATPEVHLPEDFSAKAGEWIRKGVEKAMRNSSTQ